MLAVLLAAGVATNAQAATPSSFYGLSSQTPLESSEYRPDGHGRGRHPAHAAQLGGGRPGPAAADYQWGSFDAVVADAARNEIEVLPFLFGTPGWVARDLDGQSCGDCTLYRAARRARRSRPGASSSATPSTATGPTASSGSSIPSCRRRRSAPGRSGTSRTRRASIARVRTVKGYAKLLDGAATAIRARDPAPTWCSAGWPSWPARRKAVPGPEYLHELYRRAGARKDFDGVAPHPYGASIEGVGEQVDAFRKEMKRAGDSGAGLWVTEIGWGSANGGNPLNRGKQGQARLLKEAFKYFAKRRGKLNTEVVVWFSWRDSKDKICDWCATSGLFTKSLKPKPSWRAYQKVAG